MNKKNTYQLGRLEVFTSQLCLWLTISVDTPSKAEKNPCRTSAEAVRSFQTHSVLPPMRPCCTDLGIGLHSLKFPSPYLSLINNWGWPLLRKPPTAKCEISAQGHMIKDKFIAHVTYSIFLDPPDETCQFTKENYLCLHLYPNSSHARLELHEKCKLSSLFWIYFQTMYKPRCNGDP